MILVNKFVLSGYGFSAGISLMVYQVYYCCWLYTFHAIVFSFCSVAIGWHWQYFPHHVWLQNIVSVIIVSTLSLSGVIPTEPLTWKLIKVWLPVNIIFVGMLITSMFRCVQDLQIILIRELFSVQFMWVCTYILFFSEHGIVIWIKQLFYVVVIHIPKLLSVYLLSHE
jgi:GDP-mannose transporter